MQISLKKKLGTIAKLGFLLSQIANFIVDIDGKSLSPKIIFVHVLFVAGLALALVGDYWAAICKAKCFLIYLWIRLRNSGFSQAVRVLDVLAYFLTVTLVQVSQARERVLRTRIRKQLPDTQ
jgi:hypothetical protein